MIPTNSGSPNDIQGQESRRDWRTILYFDRRLLLLVVGLILIAGLSSMMVLPRMEDPILAKRVAIINTFLPGADAARVEALVSEKLEDVLRDIEEIKELRSSSRAGVSTVIIELLDSVKKSETVWSKVRSRIEDALPELPRQATRPQFNDLEVRAYARILSVVWNRPDAVDYSVLSRTAKRLQDQLQVMSGTESVDRFGDPGEEVLVKLDSQRAAALGLSADSVASQLAANDAKDAAGQMRGDGLDLPLEVKNQFRDISSVTETDIQTSNGRFLRLEEIAEISVATPDPAPRLGRHGKFPAVTLGVLIRPEVRIDLWANTADKVIDDFRSSLPAGITIERVMDQSTYVMARLESLFFNLTMGGLAVCVVILVLMGWRSAIVVASSLPLTVFAVLFGLRCLEIPVHQMSISGLIIALGLLIDNAIVVADEIQTELVKGLSPADAISQTVRKLMVPLLGSTLTTAFAFAPIALMPGPAGEFVGSIAISVILAIFFSLLFSMTIIAAFSAILIRIPSKNVGSKGMWEFLKTGWAPKSLATAYRRALTLVLSRPKTAIAGCAALSIVGFYLATKMPEQFFPAADRNQFHINLELATSSSILDTQRIAKRIDEVLARDSVHQIDWLFGESAPSFYYNVIQTRKGASNFGQAIVQVDEATDVRALIRELQIQFDREIPDARVLVKQLEQGPPFNAPVEVRLFGPDIDQLREYGEQIRGVLASVSQVTHTTSMLSETLPKVSLNVDAQSASLAGLNPQLIATQIQGSLDGRIGGSIVQETEELPVRVRMTDATRNELRGVRSLNLVASNNGKSDLVPLQAVASADLVAETGAIVRLNRRRMNEVSAFLNAGTLPANALREFKTRLDASGFKMPAGYEMVYGGEASKRNDAVGNLLASVGILAALMVATLVLSFGSFRLAGLIGIVGVFSIGMGMTALWISGYPFGFMAIIGTMGLIGVAINDSIVVLATLKDNHATQSPTISEIVDTVMSCTRHVLATTFTTVAGFLPLIANGGMFWPPLAVCIGGGVIGATILALVFVPASFRLIYCSADCVVETKTQRVSNLRGVFTAEAGT